MTIATYIILIDYTDQGIRAVKDSPNPLDAAKERAKDLGGEIKQAFLTLGCHDIVAILELPDDEAAARFGLGIGSLGNVRTTTLRAFAEDEYREIIASLP